MFCQSIEIGRVDFRVSRAAQHIGWLVIDKNQENIRLFFNIDGDPLVSIYDDRAC
jgi:hypothetical protein